ncbi:MAG TPA: hypothetical protein VLA75_07200 [Thermoanaerobaculia bacterium]|nr:hypothetical protein [Thermoanaerobaculia bacterium]
MLRSRVRAWIAVSLLLCGPVPAFAAIGIGLHLAGEGHGGDAFAADLAAAATHGHHHAFDTAEHDHAAIRCATAAAVASGPVTLNGIPAPGFAVAARDESPPLGFPPRSRSPELYQRHRALLL